MLSRFPAFALALLFAALARPAPATDVDQVKYEPFDTAVSDVLPTPPAGATSFRVEATAIVQAVFVAENRTRSFVPYWDARANVLARMAGQEALLIVQSCDYDGLEPFDGLGFEGPDTRALRCEQTVPFSIPWSIPIDQYQPYVIADVECGVHEWWAPIDGYTYPWGFDAQVNVRIVGRVLFEFGPLPGG